MDAFEIGRGLVEGGLLIAILWLIFTGDRFALKAYTIAYLVVVWILISVFGGIGALALLLWLPGLLVTSAICDRNVVDTTMEESANETVESATVETVQASSNVVGGDGSGLSGAEGFKPAYRTKFRRVKDATRFSVATHIDDCEHLVSCPQCGAQRALKTGSNNYPDGIEVTCKSCGFQYGVE